MVSSLLTPIILEKFPVSHPLSPAWLNKFYDIVFTEYSAVAPSGNSSSYIQVSRIGFSLHSPIRLPPEPHFLFFTFASTGLPSLFGRITCMLMYWSRDSRYGSLTSSFSISISSIPYGRSLLSSSNHP